MDVLLENFLFVKLGSFWFEGFDASHGVFFGAKPDVGGDWIVNQFWILVVEVEGLLGDSKSFSEILVSILITIKYKHLSSKNIDSSSTYQILRLIKLLLLQGHPRVMRHHRHLRNLTFL